MSPDPDHPFDPEDITYFFDNWCSLSWSPWVPFSADKHTFYEIPHEPGVYRIRPAGKDFLMYIGQTGRTTHQRLNELHQTLRRSDLMPWNDPHTAAPSLWAWSDWSSGQEEEKNPQDSSNSERFSKSSKMRRNQQDSSNIPTGHYEYECSAAPLDASINGRRGMESFLLYRYRQEYGASTLCNFGRFHPRYRKSTNRKEGSRGGKLEADQKDNPAGGPSYPPLRAAEKPGEPGWMGLTWSGRETLVPEKIRNAPAGPGLYILIDSGSQEIMYIGQSGNCAKRLLDHSRKSWDGKELNFSFHALERTILPYHLKELENDLIGNFFELYRKAPEFQFRNNF